MGMLTRNEILKEMEKGNIKITPFDKSQVGPGSVDLHLGDEFRVFKKVHKLVHVNDNANHVNYSRKVKPKDYILLMPSDTILGITKERITLAPNICARLEGRSRFARMGLLVHISASFIQPGIDNRQVLEMSNMSKMPLAIHPGTRICQMIFERTEGSARYKGIFSKQNEL